MVDALGGELAAQLLDLVEQFDGRLRQAHPAQTLGGLRLGGVAPQGRIPGGDARGCAGGDEIADLVLELGGGGIAE